MFDFQIGPPGGKLSAAILAWNMTLRMRQKKKRNFVEVITGNISITNVIESSHGIEWNLHVPVDKQHEIGANRRFPFKV